MDDDLTKLLRSWPFETGRINARRITGEDDRDKIQIRLELGVLQMEADGRPDGQRPEDCDSLLDARRKAREAYHREAGAVGFVLGPEECRALREEAVQYYHRYVALFSLADYAAVIRDTKHNLAILDLCRENAAEPADQQVLEQFRTSVIMTRSRAEAELAVAAGDRPGAKHALESGLAEIRQVFQDRGEPSDAFEHANETQLLKGMLEALVPKLPMSQRAELEDRMRAALDAENYELAAILRDELRLM
ncbi:MAG: UvrB/UvrC motif-containing protein [Planctomycetota bacterium]|jgi:hypothetical protein